MNPKEFLLKLNKQRNILKEREAKHAGNAPLDLLNQIEDYEKALDLTEQAINGAITEAEWLDQLQPLLIAGNDWTAISLAAMLVLSHYAQPNGESLGQTIGAPALGKAGQIQSLVLEQVKAIDPRTAQKYPDNPTGYAAPLNDVLDELLAANQDFVTQLKTMLAQYQSATDEYQADRGATATLTGPGVITQRSTQTAGERGVVGSSAGGNIITGDGNVVGDISVSDSPGVAIGTGHRVTVTQGISGEELAALFTALKRQVENNTGLNPDDKADVKAELKDLQTEATAAASEPPADDNFIRRRLHNLERMAPDIIDTIATTAVNPVAGVKGVWDKIVAKAREIKAARQAAKK